MPDRATRCRPVALGEAGVLDQPRRAGLHAGRRPAARPAHRRGRRSASRTGLVKNEPALHVSWSSASSTIPLPRRRPRTASRTSASGARCTQLDAEGPGQLCVRDRGPQRADGELERDVQDDVPSGIGLEPGGAVAEPAVGVGEGADALERAVPDPDRGDGLRDLLPVGADVLDRRRADPSGDAGERLDADPPALDREGDEVVPALARRDPDEDAAAGRVVGVGGDSAGGDLDDTSVEACIGDHEVAAAAEHQDGLVGVEGRRQLRLGRGGDPLTRRTTEPQRGVVGESAGHVRGHEGRPWACRAPSVPRTSRSARPS